MLSPPGSPLITQEDGIIGLVPYTPPDQYNQLFALITNQHESMTKDFFGGFSFRVLALKCIYYNVLAKIIFIACVFLKVFLSLLFTFVTCSAESWILVVAVGTVGGSVTQILNSWEHCQTDTEQLGTLPNRY